MIETMDAFVKTSANINTETEVIANGIRAVEGALDPGSQAAQHLLMDNANKQNSIAVGGFVFLRFLVPAITSPEAYSLVHDTVPPHTRKTLVMVAKLLQNLSNGQRFGGKEENMEGLNNFIESNRAGVYELFDRWSTL